MHHDLKNIRATLKAAQIVDAFVTWLRDGGEGLTAAAELLGGEKWKDRADAVLAALIDGVMPADLIDELSDLHRLLTLEFADDLDSAEAALFFAVHPDDPKADEARLCAEALERGLRAMAMVAAAGGPENREAA